MYIWDPRKTDTFLCGNHLSIEKYSESSEAQTVELNLFSNGHPDGTNKAGTLTATIQVIPGGGQIDSPRHGSPVSTAPDAGVVIFTPIEAKGLSRPDSIVRDLSAYSDNTGLKAAAMLMITCPL